MYVYLALALLSAALSGFGTWRVNEWRHDSLDKARIEQAREDYVRKEKRIDVAAVGHEKDKAQIRTVTKIITHEVERIVKEPFYIATDAPACFDDSGLLQLRAAVAGQPATASSAPGAVPRP